MKKFFITKAITLIIKYLSNLSIEARDGLDKEDFKTALLKLRDQELGNLLKKK